VKILGIKLFDIGFSNFDPNLKDKINYVLVKDSYKINDYLYTTGELNAYPYDTPLSKKMVHYNNGKWEKDPIIDDLSLVIKSKDGLVLICGCCHSGLLNVCSYASKVFNTRISTIIGGTHMLFFSKKEIENIAKTLEEEFGKPKLYLNHCTRKKKIKQLEQYFGDNIVQNMSVGTKLIVNLT